MTFDFLPLDSLEFYPLSFRIVRLERDDGTMISFLTNLPQDEFPLSELKQLYSRRWGVETSFRSLKYTVGLIHLHAKRPDFVLQEIFAAFLIFNFAQASLWSEDVSRGLSQYQRHVNFSDTVYACCLFLRRTLTDPLPLLRRKLLPFRPGRYRPRPKLAGNCICTCYTSAR